MNLTSSLSNRPLLCPCYPKPLLAIPPKYPFFLSGLLRLHAGRHPLARDQELRSYPIARVAPNPPRTPQPFVEVRRTWGGVRRSSPEGFGRPPRVAPTYSYPTIMMVSMVVLVLIMIVVATTTKAARHCVITLALSVLSMIFEVTGNGCLGKARADRSAHLCRHQDEITCHTS